MFSYTVTLQNRYGPITFSKAQLLIHTYEHPTKKGKVVMTPVVFMNEVGRNTVQVWHREFRKYVVNINSLSHVMSDKKKQVWFESRKNVEAFEDEVSVIH
jgi:hypothetical protein